MNLTHGGVKLVLINDRELNVNELYNLVYLRFYYL